MPIADAPAATARRRGVLDRIARAIAALPGDRIVRVAVDGVDGAGKTWFADELARSPDLAGRAAIRASVDGFHHPRAVRYRRGRDSPDGFYLDSYDYAALRHELLDPLGPGGSGRYRTAIFDQPADRPIVTDQAVAPAGAVLILDGIFLHRPELRACWDLSIFLDVAFAVSIPRGASRGPGFGSPDPAAASNRRYIDGQRRYLRECRPSGAATVLIDHNDLGHPRILRWRAADPDARP